MTSIILPGRPYKGYAVSLETMPERWEVQGLLTEDVGRVLLGYPPRNAEVVAVATSLESARATLPSGLSRLPTASPQVEIWV